VVLAGVLREEGGKPRSVDASMKARDLDLEYGKDLQVRVGADLTAKGAWSSVLVAGEVRFEDLVWVPSLDLTGVMKSLQARRTRPPDAKPHARSPWTPGLSFDVALVARDAIHVEGLIGDAELGGTLRVKGTPEAPVVLGSIASTRGTVNLLGSVFDLSRCRIAFSDPLAVDPDLDVVASTTKNDEEITIRIDGKASKAQLLLSSSKGRSQTEIVSVLLGGSGTSSGSELSAAAARMAVRGASSPLLGALGAQVDLEIVPLPTTPEGEEFLFSVGKDLGGGVSATYYKGVSGETTDAVEMKWRLSSRARGRLRQNQDGSLSGGFRIRHDLD
jgi:autotransporter translocation and assembly factor TamB